MPLADLVKMNQRVAGSLETIFLLSDEALRELMEDVRSEIGSLYRIAEAIAMLDMLQAFTKAATGQGYTRPEFTSTLAVSLSSPLRACAQVLNQIKAGRHPIMDRFETSGTGFVANDTFSNASA